MAEEPKKKHKWIKAAIKPAHKGKFKAKAEAAGKSTSEFAAEHKGDKGVLGREARLAGTLMGMHHKHKAPSNPRAKLYGGKKMSKKSDKLYGDSPKMERNEHGKMHVSKKKKHEEKKGEHKGGDKHEEEMKAMLHRHAEERLKMHHAHEAEHLKHSHKVMAEKPPQPIEGAQQAGAPQPEAPEADAGQA